MTATAERTDAHRFWNDTPFRSYLFNAFSLLLPSGEQFIIKAIETTLQSTSCTAALTLSAQQFVREEKAHQRAHRTYNQQLAVQGYNAPGLEHRIENALGDFQRRLSPTECLCLAAAFEYMTALVAIQAVHKPSWLSTQKSQQGNLWRWHCAEEIAHHHVALDLLAAKRVGYWMRVGLYLGASLALLGDVARHIVDFYRSDRAARNVRPGEFWQSAAAFFLTNGWSFLQMGGGWLRYFLPLSMLRTTASAAPMLEVRFLQHSDMAQLLVLEQKKWDQEQAAQAPHMTQRIAAYPQLCIGAFSTRTGEALASLFMKPITTEELHRANTWAECAITQTPPPRDTTALFGISLSSMDAVAVEAIFEFFWPYALKGGWRHIYLGSPVPGLSDWKCNNPGQPVEAYVHATRKGLPRDPQLRYYASKGFKKIIACKPNYFPHEPSLNYGAVIQGRIPLSALASLWKRTPLPWLQGFRRLLFAVL